MANFGFAFARFFTAFRMTAVRSGNARDDPQSSVDRDYKKYRNLKSKDYYESYCRAWKPR